ncbi:MAG: hypothetical protein ACR2JQ_09680 [Mycobacteriales bacterium]
MSTGDYALNLLLVALVIRQIHGRKLTTVGLLWPIGLVVLAGLKYLHAIPTGGHDVVLVLGGALLGAILGCLCGAFTRIRRVPNGSLLAQATGIAAALWVLGVGARMGFALYAEHGGAGAIARFSTTHHITGTTAWTGCLILMALTEVVGRTAVLATRAHLRTGAPQPELVGLS